MANWRREAREDGIQEVLPNDSGSTQSEVILDDDDDDDDQNDHTPRQLSPTQALRNLDELLNILLNQDNENLTTLITEAIQAVETMKISSLKQNSITNLIFVEKKSLL